jgi:proteasome regulatory subunit
MNQQSFAVIDVLPWEKDPAVVTMEVEERPTITYSDIGGLEDQIQEIKETVELPLLHPELFEKVGIEPPKGVLLFGPPGTGKTMLAKAVAHETNSTFIRLIGSELVRKYIGEGARLVRELFKMAMEKAPSIIFVDELDAIGAKRTEASTSGDREVQRTLMQLLAEMDGFNPRNNVRFIGATNRLDIIDPAMLRPGRFDRLIEVVIPDFDARKNIFAIHTRNMNIHKNIALKDMAGMTEDSSGADIKAICTEAGMFAIRENRDKVIKADFEMAIVKVLSKKTEGGLPEIAGVMYT